MTLRQFVSRHGGQEKAAHKIGVSFVTLNGWLNGKQQPSALAQARLRELGVTFKHG